MESNLFIGLLRIDFKGGHKNPSIITETVPEFLKPFADKWLDPSEPHMHVFVENYKPLVWAIPLSKSDFPVKELKDPSDVSNLILNFGKKVNLISKINIQNAIF